LLFGYSQIPMKDEDGGKHPSVVLRETAETRQAASSFFMSTAAGIPKACFQSTG
jgi:hypothetical protein